VEGPLNVDGTWNVDLAIGMAEGALHSTGRVYIQWAPPFNVLPCTPRGPPDIYYVIFTTDNVRRDGGEQSPTFTQHILHICYSTLTYILAPSCALQARRYPEKRWKALEQSPNSTSFDEDDLLLE